MKCLHCGARETAVMDSRPVEDGACIRRRRVCERGHRFTTYERASSWAADKRGAAALYATLSKQLQQLGQSLEVLASKAGLDITDDEEDR